MDNPFKAKEGQQTCNSCVHYERCAELNKSTEHLDGCVTCKCWESRGDNIQDIKRIVKTACNKEGIAKRCPQRIAEAIVNAGYGDTKKAVQEFAEKVKPLIDELVELLFNDDEPDCKVDNCEKGNDIPCGCSICIEENKQFWKSKVDKLIKEIYGDKKAKINVANIKPKVVTLCGSTKFKTEFEAKNRELTLAGNIVISVACFGHSGDIFTDEQKVLLDEIHKRKIDLADAIYVINKDGYIGSSTRSEIEYAKALGKEIIYMETAYEEHKN